MPKAKIIIVEDEAIIAMDIKNTLESLGYIVLAIASDGTEAIRRVGELLPDLVLMDIYLKNGIDGVEAATSIKQHYNIPIVYLTAYSDEETMQRAKVTEPYGYLLKPFEKRELQIVIAMALYKHKTDEALRISHDQLERQVKERTHDLEATAVENSRLYLEAQEAIRLRDEFLSIASHELRTPLTSLYLRLQTLRRKAEAWKRANSGFSLDELLETIDAAVRHTRRLADLVDELLDITRVRLGRLELHVEELDLIGLIKEIIIRMNPALTQSGSKLLFESNEQLIGNWDRSRIEQVLVNLISNGIKYGKGNPIEMSAQRLGMNIVIQIADHGIGIPEKEQKRIFERFERAVGSSNISGLGLGLYISRQIIEAHGGFIRLESELGKGSTFTIELPPTSSSVIENSN